ncbi:ankyrin repeat domain-containing protein 26-like isoform X5 [Grus americana]|uniref:ankyrin repeat domain-containing protein 26-like isoform X5 n=1 Tax=Grus americana TaxID=9117 RepID=UPI0024083768|nr:ankyrin repeat domain-containing protein 26-like isoform X5 [Grus americana]
MKRFFGFGRKRKGQPPSGSASVPCPAGAYEVRQKDLGKLHRAAASGDLARVRQGLKKHGIDGRDKAERTPLHLACASGHVDVVTYLVENKCKLNLLDNDNRSPLMKAVQCQQEECVAILLEHGADPNLADADGNTALHLAVISANTSVAGLLLEHNANIDAHNKEGYTPLFLAVSEHHEEIVELLLKKGADVHARDQCERTPLMTAASGGELNLIKVLLRYGADVSHKDSQGWTAEDYAVIHGYSSLSEQLAEYTDWENTGEASAGGAQGITVLSTPHRTGAAGFTLGAPAMDRGAIDDFSQGDSISSEKEGSDDSWHTSEEEELDFTPKKLQKPNLTLLMKASQLFRKNNDGDGSKIESPKTPKSRLKQRTPSHANLNKGVRGELLNQDVSDGSNFEEEELEEKDDDENENGDDDDEDSEEEEEDEEDEDLEDEETRSNDILEEEQGEKSEPKRKINQKLEYFSNAKFEGQAQCGTGDVYDDKISKELDEEVEESVDTPVSFIAGCFERLQENVTAMSPKRMNNEVSCKSVPKQPVFQNVNNLQNTQESWGRKSMIQKFHENADSFLADSEMTGCKKELLQPLSHSCGLKEKKSNFGDDFESGNNSSSAAKNLRLQSQRQNSVVLEHMDDEDTEEEQYEQVDDKVCEALKQSESLHSNRCEENLRAAFHSSTREESPQREEEGKEDTGEELRTTVVESVKNSICNDSHQVHNASKGNAGLPEKPSNSQLKAPESVLEMSETSPKKRQQKSGALPPVGAEEDEDDESPWDSESIETDSESMRKGSSGVLLSAADRRGASSQVASGEHNNGLPEKPSNSQLKAPESVLEMSETSPEKRQQKSGALPPVGAEEDEDDESPWDSESIETDSESMRKGSSGVLLSAADRRGASSQVASGEHNNGLPEKPSNSQLKAPESVLEMSETSPEKRQQKSGEYSGSTSHVSSSAAKQDIKDAIENYGVQVELEKSKERCFKTEEVAKQEDLDKFNTPPGNVTNQQMKQKLTLRKNDCLKMENENTIEEKDKKNLEEKDKKNCSPEERSKLIKMPMKGKFALNAKVARKNKRQTSKQKANQQMSSSSGNHFQVLDDSTFSETSQDDGRLAAKTGTEKNKVSIQMDVTDDLDLTHSSDTTSEDVELPTSIYREAMLLLEQLSVDPRGSAVLLKIQNILLEYEQIIEREKNRYTAVWRALRKLESEKEESQLMAEETKDWKSILAHQEVEWKSDIQTLKFTLKQEEEKRLRVETLYEKTREKLRRREDQCCKGMEEKQQLELHSRNLEMELLTLRKVLKQVEEERDETQRQLSQEKSARALQEGILNNHLWRQKELEEEARTTGKNVEESETKREKDLLYKNQLLQDEIAMLRLELDQVRLRHQEEKGKYLEENETLKEKNEDLKKELKLNEEALTQTVFQYNGQLNLLKTESAVLTSKLEQTKESKDRLETEIESFRSRLTTAVQELEHHQSTKSDVERTFQRERDEWLRLQDKLHHDLSDVRETNKSLSQQLSKAESKANSLENELHQLKQMLREKTLLLEMTQKELSQAQCQAKECDRARQLEKDQVSKFIIKQESMQERLSQLQSENLLLRQQLEDMQNKGIIKEKVVNAVQDRFNDIFNKLRADTEKQVYLVEERNKELNVKCTDLRDQVFKYETDKVEREGMVRQLQQELADALKKQSMSEASLEVTTRYRSDLEEDKLRLQKELETVKTKLQELEEQRLQSEHCVRDLKTALDNKEREVTASSQKLQDLLLASSGANTTVKQLEEHVQRLEIENARLEATVHQQSSRIEALQRDLQASASVHNRLEDLITGLQTTQAAVEDHHQQQMQKQNVLAWTSKDAHSMWEEQLKSRYHLEERVAQLDREKAELLEQCESERKQAKKLAELKRPVELRLDQEMKRNIELQKDCKRLKRLLNRAMNKLRMYKERESQLHFQGEMKNRYSEMVNEVGRLRAKVGEHSQQLEIESKKCMQLEAQNQDLREELSTMHGNHEELEKSKCQLKEEVANLKHHLETNMVDHSQIEQYKREMEERTRQEIRQRLQEVNLFLQTQAASQDRLEQIRANHHASLRNQLKHRIRDLECELDRIKSTQKDSIFQKESTQAEVERYKGLYLEEVKIRRCLANKLQRANERLAEANAKLLQERHRSKSLIASSIVSGGLAASPVLYSAELGHLGNNLALNRSVSLGGSFLSPTGNALASRNRVEAYVAKVRQELDEKITKELEQATAELEAGSAGASPMVSIDGSSKNVHVDQDPLCRAIQEYRDVLTKNYMI